MQFGKIQYITNFKSWVVVIKGLMFQCLIMCHQVWESAQILFRIIRPQLFQQSIYHYCNWVHLLCGWLPLFSPSFQLTQNLKSLSRELDFFGPNSYHLNLVILFPKIPSLLSHSIHFFCLWVQATRSWLQKSGWLSYWRKDIEVLISFSCHLGVDFCNWDSLLEHIFNFIFCFPFLYNVFFLFAIFIILIPLFKFYRKFCHES